MNQVTEMNLIIKAIQDAKDKGIALSISGAKKDLRRRMQIIATRKALYKARGALA